MEEKKDEIINDNDDLELNLKKKKKKKKTGFSLDGDLAEPVVTATAEPEAIPESDDLNLERKKKKKKKKVLLTEELDETAPAEGGENVEEELNLTAKKKSKKSVAIITDGHDQDEEKVEISGDIAGAKTWDGSDRDYNYDELLNRVFDIMRQKNPEMVAGEKKRFIMKPPQCARVGTKKTSFVNFTEICQMLKRQPKHILAFILAELGTSGSVDGNNQLIIKGRFQQKQLESVLRRYIKEYVTCHTCRSPDTVLERDVRLHFLRCNVCQSRCSVATIKSGFQALTGKRARMRAKAT